MTRYQQLPAQPGSHQCVIAAVAESHGDYLCAAPELKTREGGINFPGVPLVKRSARAVTKHRGV